MHLGVLYKQLNQPQKAIQLWQEALTKLHPDSPHTQTVGGWLAAGASRRRRPWKQWVLGGLMLAFAGFNVLSGHWVMAVGVVVVLGGWVGVGVWRGRR